MIAPVIQQYIAIIQVPSVCLAGVSLWRGHYRRIGRFAGPRIASAESVATGWMSRCGLRILRVGLGVVYLWFGGLKLVPSLSPAQGLVTGIIGFVDPRWLMPGLAVWEMAIGLSLIFGVFHRAALTLLFLHMMGAVLPLLTLRTQTWTVFPFVPTLEGQYILKNIVLIGAALVLGGTLKRPPVTPTPGSADHPE